MNYKDQLKMAWDIHKENLFHLELERSKRLSVVTNTMQSDVLNLTNAYICHKVLIKEQNSQVQMHLKTIPFIKNIQNILFEMNHEREYTSICDLPSVEATFEEFRNNHIVQNLEPSSEIEKHLENSLQTINQEEANCNDLRNYRDRKQQEDEPILKENDVMLKILKQIAIMPAGGSYPPIKTD